MITEEFSAKKSERLENLYWRYRKERKNIYFLSREHSVQR